MNFDEFSCFFFHVFHCFFHSNWPCRASTSLSGLEDVSSQEQLSAWVHGQDMPHKAQEVAESQGQLKAWVSCVFHAFSCVCMCFHAFSCVFMCFSCVFHAFFEDFLAGKPAAASETQRERGVSQGFRAFFGSRNQQKRL